MNSNVGTFIDGLSNLYVVSTATVFLAVIIALYCANFLNDENEKQANHNMETTIGDEKASAPIENNNTIEEDDDDEDDLVHEADGILSKLKAARLKELESQLTQDQLEEERKIEQQQLAAIFDLLKKQESELNTEELNESELTAQLNLYR